MREMTLDQYMAHPWVPAFEQLPEGDFRLTVPGLADFELFAATKPQLEAEWKSALRSHLMGYLKVGKVIPIPTIRVQEPLEIETSTGSKGQVVFLSEGLQIRLTGADMGQPA